MFSALLAGVPAFSQAPASAPPTPAPPSTAPPDTSEPALPKGQILFQSHGEPPSGTAPAPPANTAPGQERRPGDNAKADITDAQRSALIFLSYDLDARVNRERSGLTMRARVVVRNGGTAALNRIPLQISSTLHWDSATLVEGAQRTRLALAQHQLDTDADHTGAATEAVLTLPEPLAPAASIALDLFYSGTLAQSGSRLARLGATPAQQLSADWDGISLSWTGLRGFGNVLWYPVASPQLFLADGNTLFTAIGRARLQDEGVSVRLRLAVDYTGEPPAAAYFCGRRAELKATPDDPDAPTAAGSGVASAEFSAAPLGFRLPSLFVIQERETLLGGPATPESDATAAAPGGVSSSAGTSDSAAGGPALVQPNAAAPSGPVIALVSGDKGTASGLTAAAGRTVPLLADWLGPRPLSVLTVLDHDGQPFQDGPLLVAPAATLQTSTEAPALVYSLTHAWVQTGQPWMDEGLAQFFALLWVEREHGREAAVAQLDELMQPVAVFGSGSGSGSGSGAPPEADAGQPLIAASDELIYRRKAAAVWWMLRDLAGEQPLQAALRAWRTQPALQQSPAAQAVAFEKLLGRLSGKDLGWFFNDWVLHDRGLPDLTIVDVETSQTPAGPGHNTGWLVAVTVRNEGGAVADVPVVVSSGDFKTTQRIRIPGESKTTQRVLVEAAPTEITVNDGSTPEVRASVHTRQLNDRQQGSGGH